MERKLEKFLRLAWESRRYLLINIHRGAQILDNLPCSTNLRGLVELQENSGKFTGPFQNYSLFRSNVETILRILPSIETNLHSYIPTFPEIFSSSSIRDENSTIFISFSVNVTIIRPVQSFLEISRRHERIVSFPLHGPHFEYFNFQLPSKNGI